MLVWSKLRFKYQSFLLPLIIYLLNILVIQSIGLSADGAHYALYAKHLSLGYVDHPPLIGWLQALVIFVFHKNEFSLHLVPLLFSFFSLLLLHDLAEKFNLKNSYLITFCFISVVWNALTFLAITQAPLIFFCVLSCCVFYRWLNSTTFLMSMILGISLGLSGLADYSSFLVALGFLIYLLIYQPKKILSAHCLLTACTSILCVSPFLFWNANHHWISFTAGYDHSLSGDFSWHWFGQAILLQLLGYSPALVIYGLIGAVNAIKNKNPNHSLLAIPGLLIIILMNFAGMHHKIFFHWPALGYMLLAPLAYDTIIKSWASLWTKVIVIFSILLTTSVYIIFYLQIFFAPIHFALGKNPLMDLYGWSAIGHEAHILANQSGFKNPVLYVPNWSLASRLAWYSDLPVQILQPSPIAGYKQFILWYGEPNKLIEGILVIPYPWPKPNTNHACTLIKTMPMMIHKQLMTVVDFYRCGSAPTN
jgi:4-amino-4-deoxy-L-arabinose transferase-like glycosyltransferase